MKKYRILEKTSVNGSKKFIPQVKERVFIFTSWCDFRGESLFSISSFNTLKEAKDYLKEYRGRQNKSTKKHYIH